MLGRGFRLGRLFGIQINIDWSWLLIFTLITWNLASVFEGIHPNWSPVLRWGTALLASVLFFGSVLAHELAHSLVALRQGLAVKEITLFLFGGAAQIQREPDSPKNEFWMAIAGPLSSLVIGALMLGIVALTATLESNGGGVGALMSRLSPLNTLLVWLGSINILLAVFNMIPGFPLDGGRVLRSILWKLTDNLRTATRWAAWIGQAIAWMMIIGGIAMAFGVTLPFFGTGLVSGLWLAFIGWFLNNSSVQSYQQVAIQDILEGVPVSRIMRSDPPTVEPDCTVADLIHQHVMGSDDQAFPVLENEQLVGIVTLDDVRRIRREEWENHLVSDIMTPSLELVTAAPNEEVSDAMERLIERDVRQLPVVHQGAGPGEGRFLGLLRRSDIMRWLQLQSGDHANNGRNRLR